MKKLLSATLIAAGLSIILMLAGCSSAPAPTNADSSAFSSGKHHATVQVKEYGSFTIELDADQAPITVANFCKLAKGGFYDGLTFHRLVNDFCLQGGDPKGNGTGSSGSTIKGEFLANGVQNKLSGEFKKGTVAMARSRSNDSASCQFFITLSDDAGDHGLHGQYAAFGTIDSRGLETVDAIVSATLPNVKDANGSIAKENQPVIEKITITD